MHTITRLLTCVLTFIMCTKTALQCVRVRSCASVIVPIRSVPEGQEREMLHAACALRRRAIEQSTVHKHMRYGVRAASYRWCMVSE